MVRYEDIVETLTRLYGTVGSKQFEIVSVGPAFLVGRNMMDAVEIHGWEDIDLLANF